MFDREKWQNAQDNAQQTQVTFFQLNTEIARLEENIQQQQREKQRLTEDRQHVQADFEKTVSQLQQDSEALVSYEQALALLQAKVQLLSGEFHEHQHALDDHELQKISWDTQWQAVQVALNGVLREEQIEQVRLQHIEQHYQQTQLRVEKIQNEQAGIIDDSLRTELSALQEQHIGLAKEHTIATENSQSVMKKGVELRQQLMTIEQQLHQAQDKVQGLVTKHVRHKMRCYVVQKMAPQPCRSGSRIPA